MRKLLTIAAVFLTMALSAQTYVSGSFSYYGGSGTFSERGMATGELGYTFKDVFSLGVAGGTTSFSNGKGYVELRPTLTVFDKNGFTLSGTIGAGYVFNSKEDFMTEYCGTAGYRINPKWSISVFGGGYKFDGTNTASKYTFVGTGLTYIFNK